MIRRICTQFPLAVAALAGLAFQPGGCVQALAHEDHEHFSAGEPGDPQEPSRTVKVSMLEDGKRMLFDPPSIEVRLDEQIRFVTGKLDPLATRTEFLDVARRSTVPMLMLYGAQTPSRSRAEMEALASVPSMRSAKLPLGKLSVHEEFPGLVAEAVEPFLSDRS